MDAVFNFLFSRADIEFPENISPCPGSDDYHAWARSSQQQLKDANHPFAALTVCNSGDYDRGLRIREKEVIVTFSSIFFDVKNGAISPATVMANEEIFRRAFQVTLCLRILVPQNEGYVRGIHGADGSKASALVTYDPTERLGQPQYCFQAAATTLAELSELMGEILKGRTPEIVHSLKLPCS